MRNRSLLFLALSAAIAATAWTQSASTGRSTSSSPTDRSKNPGQRIPSVKRTDAKGKAGVGKVVTPDPDLLDGSLYEAEKRPLHGMLSTIEMGEEESSQKQDKISPNSGDPGGGGAEPPPEQKAGGSGEKPPEGPEAKPEGIKVERLEVPEGAEAQQAGGEQSKPRDLQIGDATLQIQTIPSNPNVVGVQSTSTQQYEKKVPQGQQTDNRNRGVEKGKEMPKGL